MPKTKDDRIQKVLEILNLPAEEQLTWVALNNNIIQIDVWEWDDVNNIVIPIEINWRILADLAFRMRDETLGEQTTLSQQYVWSYLHKELYKLITIQLLDKVRNDINTRLAFEDYWRRLSQKIHWILAAICAKILAENGS